MVTSINILKLNKEESIHCQIMENKNEQTRRKTTKTTNLSNNYNDDHVSRPKSSHHTRRLDQNVRISSSYVNQNKIYNEKPKSSFQNHQYDRPQPNRCDWPQSNQQSKEHYWSQSRQRDWSKKQTKTKDSDDSSDEIEIVQEKETEERKTLRSKSSFGQHSQRPYSSKCITPSRCHSAYSRSTNTPSFMPSTQLYDGYNYYLCSLAKIYDVTPLKRLKEIQYRNLVTRQRNLGFHTREECNRYRTYLNGPRTQEYGKDYITYETTRSRSRPRSPRSGKHTSTAPSGASNDNKSRDLKKKSSGKKRKEIKNEMEEDGRKENKMKRIEGKKQSCPKGLEKIEVHEETKENKNGVKDKRTSLLNTIICDSDEEKSESLPVEKRMDDVISFNSSDDSSDEDLDRALSQKLLISVDDCSDQENDT